MGTVDRLTRVNALLKRELAGLIERNLRTNGRAVLVSVTEVKCSVDLRHAVVYVSIFGGDAAVRRDIQQELADNRKEFQRHIGANLSFKNTPVLEFRLDDRLAAGDRILELLNEQEEKNGESTD
ncbi:30S ribosome-binding factor RbfA [Victivallis sp. Marseille-Q1083]|uniref:30S ribosome-binding factor RbfA n=1 Tax=Victivallis sp. Marseille-Q1083 TaxID=2717288 RepID=UPI00158ADA52|nr:30S ribosome-binding factor RbfA [Victivallis sp. Marseille-Q1083]